MIEAPAGSIEGYKIWRQATCAEAPPLGYQNKRDRQFNWDLMLKICALIMGFLVMAVVLVYENFIHAR